MIFGWLNKATAYAPGANGIPKDWMEPTGLLELPWEETLTLVFQAHKIYCNVCLTDLVPKSYWAGFPGFRILLHSPSCPAKEPQTGAFSHADLDTLRLVVHEAATSNKFSPDPNIRWSYESTQADYDHYMAHLIGPTVYAADVKS